MDIKTLAVLVLSLAARAAFADDFYQQQQVFAQENQARATARVADALEAQNKQNVIASRGIAYPEENRNVYRTVQTRWDSLPPSAENECHWVAMLNDQNTQAYLLGVDHRWHAVYVNVCANDREESSQ